MLDSLNSYGRRKRFCCLVERPLACGREYTANDRKVAAYLPPSDIRNDRGPSKKNPSAGLRTPAAASRALWLDRIPRAHQVDLECLDPTARPENEADDPHVLIAAESLVMALWNVVKSIVMAGRLSGASAIV